MGKRGESGGVRIRWLSGVAGLLSEARDVSVLAGEAISVRPSRAHTCAAGVSPRPLWLLGRGGGSIVLPWLGFRGSSR